MNQLCLIVEEPSLVDSSVLLKIEEYRTMLVQMNSLLDHLTESLATVDSLYRLKHTKLISTMSELIAQLNLIDYANAVTPEHAEPERKLTEEEVNSGISLLKKRLKKQAVKTYRRICNLTHPDKTKRKSFSQEDFNVLTGLYHEAQKAYASLDLITLRFILGKVAETYGTCVTKLVEAYDSVEDSLDLETELNLIQDKVKETDSKIRDCYGSGLYTVLRMHVSNNSLGASSVYRTMLESKIAQLKQQIKLSLSK
jgi:Cu2+-containing amine oxidase